MDAREIRRLVGIADVLEYYGGEVPVRETGTWTGMKCPFHDDNVASASVSYDYDAFVCHACSVKGDVVGVVEKAEGLSFREAKEWIEDNFGLSKTGASTRT